MITASLRSAGRRAGTTVARTFTSTAKAQGGHGGPAYEHAEHMYDIGSMSNRGLKFGLGIFGGMALGCAIPLIAVKFQQMKAQG